jgi:hypothetical protein
MTQSEQPKHPFFARFLETQNKQTNNEEENSSITGENFDDAMTLKWPSDRDDHDPDQ